MNDFRPLFATLVALALALPAAAPSAAPTPAAASPAGVEAMPAETYLARQATVPIRTDPGFVYREVRVVRLGDEVEVDGRLGSWLRVRGGGWVLGEHLWTRSEAAAAPPRPTELAVLRNGARVREKPRTDAAIVNTLDAEAVIDGVVQQDGWWQLASGGWISATLVTPRVKSLPATARPIAGATKQPAARSSARRWSLMSLNGTMFEVYEIANEELIRAVRGEMRATRVLEDDWTYLGLTIGVPGDSAYLFRYSPDKNKIVAVDSHGRKYGNVFARGPVQKMPEHVRSLLDSREVNPGERFDGVLMFRPTLRVDKIAEISIEIQGREQKFVLSP